MDYFTTDIDGLSLINPSEEEMRGLLEAAEATPDADYPEVYLTNAEEDVIGYRCGGTLFLEEAGEIVRIIRGVSLSGALRAWVSFAKGETETVESLPWERLSE